MSHDIQDRPSGVIPAIPLYPGYPDSNMIFLLLEKNENKVNMLILPIIRDI